MTPRQEEVFNLLVAKVPISDIARTLKISRKRVYDYIAILTDKKLIKAKTRGVYIAKQLYTGQCCKGYREVYNISIEDKQLYMKIQVTNNDWKVKPIKIKDKTIISRYLPLRIPTALAMERLLNK